MFLSFENFLAFRLITSSSKSAFLSLISWISITGIALGVCALIVVISVMDGFESTMENLITDASGHFMVSSSEGAIDQPQVIQKKITQAIKGEFKKIYPFVGSQVMLASKGKVNASYIEGLPIAELKSKKYLQEGHWPEQRVDFVPEIAIGYLIARKLKLKIGDWVNVVSPFGERSQGGLKPLSKKFLLSGIFKIGMYDYDHRLAYTTMKSATEFFEMYDKVSGFRVITHDALSSHQLAKRVRKKLQFPFVAKDWSRLHPNLFSAVKLEKIVMFIILVFIILVAAFNVVSTLVMMNHEKTRDIAILKAIGASKKQIRGIFFRIGAFIGVMGTLLGVSFGLGLIYIIQNYPLIELHPDIYYISQLPFSLD